MLELLALGALCFVGLLALVALPFLLLGGLIKLLVVVILLPFRLLGAVFGVLGTVVACFLPLILIGGAIIVPLLPVLALVGLVWLLVRAARPRPAPSPVGHGSTVSTA